MGLTLHTFFALKHKTVAIWDYQCPLTVQVNCLQDICGFNGVSIGSQDDNPARPTAQQFWRWFTSPFIHLGIIHIIIIIPIQLYIGIKIERTIGWLRLGLIYLISAVGGNIVSLIVIFFIHVHVFYQGKILYSLSLPPPFPPFPLPLGQCSVCSLWSECRCLWCSLWYAGCALCGAVPVLADC